MVRESGLVAALGLLEQPHRFLFPAVDSTEHAGQDDGHRERMRVLRATRPPAAATKFMRVVGENAEISSCGFVVPPGDRVVGLVAESPRMVLVQDVAVRKRGVATADFGYCPGGFAIIAGQ